MAWIAPFKLHAVLAVTCFACEPAVVRFIFENDVLMGNLLPEVGLPEGWMNVNGRTFCDRHRVIVYHEKGGAPVVDFR
jgi:hypothetical protein